MRHSNIHLDQHLRRLHRYSRSHPLLHRLPQPLQARQPRKRWSRHKVRTIRPRRRSRSRLRKPTVRATRPSRHQDPDRRSSQASLHDQGQRLPPVDIRHLLPHHLAPQGRFLHLQHPPGAC